MKRLFIQTAQVHSDEAVIAGGDHHYVSRVLRLKMGAPLELLDGQGTLYNCVIKTQEKNRTICAIASRHPVSPENQIEFTLAQGLPKGAKMDFIIQKSTELGVSAVQPLLTERSISKINDKLAAKVNRWQKIARQACQQCGRKTIPLLKEPVSTAELSRQLAQFDLALFCSELETKLTLKTVLKQLASPPQTVLVIIGPEGGFSLAETNLLKKAGAVSVSLGKNILRTETAPLAVLAILNYHFNP